MTATLREQFRKECGTQSYTYIPQNSTTDINEYRTNPKYIQWLESKLTSLPTDEEHAKLAASAPVLKELVEKYTKLVSLTGYDYDIAKRKQLEYEISNLKQQLCQT